ncbi:MAG: hypothetical protein OEV64_05685 [Desulfobulbaceae bacterium]|nr:hypothetical protein [Desulfobulbaceae bacterium]
MNLNLEELKGLCAQLAKSVNHPSGKSTPANIRQLGTNFYLHASKKAIFLHVENKDAEVVNRTVWYICQAHAASPQKDHIAWFKDLLDALLAFAYPRDPYPVEEPQKFLQDLLLGKTKTLVNCLTEIYSREIRSRLSH